MIQQHILHYNTSGRATIEITDDILQMVSLAKITTGLCHLFLHHTSASLIFCENADPVVRQDLENFTANWILDDKNLYEHNAEGRDDMPAHLRTIFTNSELSIPITKGKLALGT